MSSDRTIEALYAARDKLELVVRTELALDDRVRSLCLEALSAVDRACVSAAHAEAEQAAQSSEVERRAREREVEVRARDEFISVIGHELRNPISPVFLQVRRLLSSAGNAPDGHVPTSFLLPQLHGISQRLERFLGVLDRILDVSRMASGRIDLVIEQVDLAELLREVASSFERVRLASQSELTLSASKPVIGRWDRLRLEQILYNLLSNAIRYGAGEPIEASVEVCGECAVLRVRDHGVGIAPADRERIFERFERATRKRVQGSFGVGLWMVKQLCGALGGAVELESTQGRGTTFKAVLPLTTDERPP